MQRRPNTAEDGRGRTTLDARKLHERVLAVQRPVELGHLPTPLEPLPNLGRELGLDLHVKRDDCTGVAFGGNKVRQLRHYLGRAHERGADTVLITGAVQSNFVRTAAAMARALSMDCHIQLEERVAHAGATYRDNGNVLLDRLFGATLHGYPDGEDEAGADAALEAIASRLAADGRRPYVVPLGAERPPLGALGYVEAAIELLAQLESGAGPAGGVDEIVVATGSALTHVGLLFGLRALGSDISVRGVCVRRDAAAQRERVTRRLDDLASLLGLDSPIGDGDVVVDDGPFAPGYGRLNAGVREAIELAARREGLLVDPVYTARALAGLVAASRAGDLAGERVVFWHTGGQPALFAYADVLVDGGEA